ncbi:MAG: PRC-barrel domain-containing protein [Clostridia bacterium]|nr:PRC-barrel domain-containing protein [Clostridia bacterium]
MKGRNNIKGSDLIGSSVICRQTGKVVGIVKDVVFLVGETKISGLFIENRDMFKKTFFIDGEDIISIGNNIILIKSIDNLIIDMDKSVFTNNKVLGLKVITDKGEELGIVHDVLINEQDYNVEAYKISSNFFDDIYNGMSTLSVDCQIMFGEDVIIVSDKNDLTSQTGGIKRLLNTSERK